MSKTEKTIKPVKAKGPIRFEAIIPIAIILGAIYLYFFLFFDTHLRIGMELGGYYAHGAEVNVANVKTDFLAPSIEISGIQVTDKNKPHRNIVQVGQMRFELLWDALLRAKLVVKDATIKNIQALVPRKSPGKVMPPAPPAEKGTGALEKVENSVLEQSKSQFNENVLADVANVLGGTDPKDQIKNIQTELKTDARVKELDKLLKEKQAAWEKRFKELPQAKEFEALAERAKKVKIDTKNPIAAAAGLQELDKIVKEADKKIKDLEKANKELNKDVGNFNDLMKDLEKMAKEDLADLQKRLKIPDIDTKEFSKGIFGKLFQEQIAEFGKYADMAREYMPETRKDAPPKLTPQQRREGINVQYPITTGYPLFWLQKGFVSSESSESEYSGDLSGELRDFTTAPKFIKKPATATIKGNFPKQKIMGLDTKITLDYTTDQGKEMIQGTIASYPVEEKKLSESKDLNFVMKDFTGKAEFFGELAGSGIYFKMNNVFTGVQYDIKAKNEILQDVLTKVTGGIPEIKLDSMLKGNLSDFHLDIRSNLGDEIALGLKKYVDAKIEEAKKEIQKFIDDKVKMEKEKLMAEFNKAKADLEKEFKAKKAEFEKAKKEIEASAKGGGGDKKGDKKSKGKKKGGVEDLLKGIKIK